MLLLKYWKDRIIIELGRMASFWTKTTGQDRGSLVSSYLKENVHLQI